jgi:hypothetical protein
MSRRIAVSLGVIIACAYLINLFATDEIIERWRYPITFFGRVIDENEAAVEGAEIEFVYNTTNGSAKQNAKSNADGTFSLKGVRGYIVGVRVQKAGYYTSKLNETAFYYGREGENHTPDERRPILFRLRKMQGIDGLAHVKRNFRVTRDGTPLEIDLQSGRTVSNGQGHLRVQCWTDDAGLPSGERYDWKCRISIPNGGLIESTNEFDFIAPENGYRGDFVIEMFKVEVKEWASDVEKKFFYRTAGGQFGRLTFSMVAGGDHFCMVNSFLNPTGSRNLENRTE